MMLRKHLCFAAIKYAVSQDPGVSKQTVTSSLRYFRNYALIDVVHRQNSHRRSSIDIPLDKVALADLLGEHRRRLSALCCRSNPSVAREHSPATFWRYAL